MIPHGIRSWLLKRLDTAPPQGSVNFGDLRRTTPLDPDFGYDRGGPLDRVYIESFLEQHSGDIRGSVLEIGERTYTERYGGSRVTRSDVLHVADGNPDATIVGDLQDAPQIPDATYDCVVFTQTLQMIFDPRAALATLARILAPGGVVLATVPGVTRTAAPWSKQWYWSFSEASAERLFTEAFSDADIRVDCLGNVLAATAFLHGLGAPELTQAELEEHDPDYPVIISVRVEATS